jgi:hypothetical protein
MDCLPIDGAGAMNPSPSLIEPTDDPTEDLFGGRVSLRRLIDSEAIPYKDLKGACAWLDGLGVAFVPIHGRRYYRRTDILRAVNRAEVRPAAA